MSEDGAHLGVDASRAISTILGGEPSPAEEEGRTPEQMRAYLEQPNQTPDEGDGDAWYAETARQIGRTILAFLDAHPEYRDLPADDTWEFPPHATSPDQGRVTALGITGRLKEAGIDPDPEDYGITGFQFGWGCNAAKYALGAPPVQNPAILVLDADG
jgi:hypothetical protein